MSVKPDPASALFAGPFALGTVSAPDGPAYPALVTPDGRTLDLRRAFGDERPTVRGLLEEWATALPRLRALASDPGLSGRPLAELRVHAPVEPRQVFQSGANYRQHVIDL